MEWNVSNGYCRGDKKVADYPQMRYFRQRGDFASGKPLDDCVNGRWVVTTPRRLPVIPPSDLLCGKVNERAGCSSWDNLCGWGRLQCIHGYPPTSWMQTKALK
ncbi:MAG: hypothetical protein ACLUKN_02010 [Bacilli bacterium]